MMSDQLCFRDNAVFGADQFEYFASCAQGFERLLADELKRLRMQRVRPLKGGVAFFGSKVDGYRACLWSRLASRILRVVDRIDASTAETLYQGVRFLPWEQVVGPEACISVTARGTNDELRNTQFSALKVKDALCDRLRAVRGVRPNVAPQRADVVVWVSIRGKKATISLDYAGESLHRRGYRAPGEQVEAPLKEALAAGMLVWGGWDRVASPAFRRAEARRQGLSVPLSAPVFIDPVCGSATLVLEAAMMATDRAPGLSRDYWGFAGHADFDKDAFDDLLAQADERFEQGLEMMPLCIGADIDERAIEIAKGNARRLGMGGMLRFVQADCACLPQTLKESGVNVETQEGFVALNPPYGVRLLSDGSLASFYEKLQHGLQDMSSLWHMVAITPDDGFDTALGFDADRTLEAYNGALEVSLRSYQLGTSFMNEVSLVDMAGHEISVRVSSEAALQFAARLRKVVKQRRKWARKNDIHAYRIYDADLPDYAVSIDWFEGGQPNECAMLITEYQAPREIDPQKAARRFADACTLAQALLSVSSDRIYTRVRRQDKGGSQYRTSQDFHRQNKGGARNQGKHQESGADRMIVQEKGYPFEINLSDYLDTGLFLDHRLTREMVGEKAEGKRFLNLFAYTGSATVYAAGGGACSTTTVDMSQTYLDWAQRNMKRAGFSGSHHRFVKADVLSWIEQEVHRIQNMPDGVRDSACYDVIFVDPPTFSNSKTMGSRTWDIQRDHSHLLACIQSMLSPEGVIIFSGNLRSFKLDEEAMERCGLCATNITPQTIPEDFTRNARIHFCYLLKHAHEETRAV